MANGNLELALKIRADMKQAYDGLNQLTRGLDGVEQSAGRAHRGVESISRQLDQMKTAALSLAGAKIGFDALSGLVRLADEYGQMAARIKMATSSAEEYDQVQQRLLATANATFRPLSEVQEAYLRTSDALRSMGYNTHQAMDVSDSLSLLFVTNAASAEKAENAINAFGKSLQTGKVDAEAWQSLLAATPSIVNDIAAASGKSAEEIRQLGATGKLALTDLTEGLRQSMSRNLEAAGKMPVTVADAFTKLRSSVQVFFGEVNSGSGATQVLTDALEGVGQAVDGLTENLDVAAQAFSGWGGDIRKLPESVAFMVDGVSDLLAHLLGEVDADSLAIMRLLDGAFKNFPANVRSSIQLVTVELASFIDKANAFGRAVKKALSSGLNPNLGISDEYRAEMERIDGVRQESIADILAEREATLSNVEAAKQEAAAKRESTKAEIERQRAAKVALKTPGLEPKKTRADPDAKALAQQEQALTVALAKARQQLADAEKGVEEATNKASGALEVWLSTHQAARDLTQSQIASLRQQASAVDAASKAYKDLTESRERDKKIAEDTAKLDIELAEQRGQTQEAALMRFAGQYKEVRARFEEAGDIVGLAKLGEMENYTTAVAGLQQVEAALARVKDLQSREEQSIQTEMEVGLLSEIDGRQRLLQIHQDTYAELQKLRPELERLSAMPGAVGQSAAAALSALDNQAMRLKSTTSLLDETLQNGLKTGLGEAIAGLAKGTMSLKDAVKSLANTIIESLIKMYANQMVASLLSGAGGLFGKGATLSTPIAAHADGGRLGGRSPHDRADNLLFLGTAGEYVTRRKITRQPGAIDFLDDFNAIGMPAILKWARALPLPRRADGGLLPAPPSFASPMAGMASKMSNGPVINFTVNNTMSDQARVTTGARENNGMSEITVLIEQVLAGDMSRNGPISRGLSNTFGMNRAV